ncbi:MAG TPA: hypothetical protein ACFCUY_15930 [Xenococcaceae cyanobacterium]|jgi:hypothetical protein
MQRHTFLADSSVKAIKRWRYAITFALMLLIWVQAKPANGSEINLNHLNGLFTPTAAQRFFEAGREDFEFEVRTLVQMNESEFTGDILQIKTEFDELPESRLNLIHDPVTSTSMTDPVE